MYATIRRYPASAGRAEEVARRVGEGLVPVLRELPGYRAYYCFVADDGRPVAVSLTRDRTTALAADERARAWVAAHMADLIPGPPEVAMGEILVDGATFGDDPEAKPAGGAPDDPEWADGGV